MRRNLSASPAHIVLWATLAGLMLFVAALVVVQFLLPLQSVVGSNRDYGYACSASKSASVDFSTASDADDSLLIFGSSELSTPARLIPEVPSAVFGLHDMGVDLNCIGEAYDQSLWQAIAAGAYAQKVTNKKVIISVSPSWFTDGGLDDETFKLRFSYSLYRAFCANPDISSGSKEYLVQRLAEQGIDETTIDAGLRETPCDYLNDAVFSAMDDLKIRNGLRSVRTLGIDSSDISDEDPSFDELRVQAYRDAKTASANNNWGVDDAFYSENISGYEDKIRGSLADETFSDTPEFDDFTFLLKVCKEAGLEPLVLISPLQGNYYDLVGVSKATRTRLYQHIKSICEKRDVKVADFTDCEYEKYFLHDQVHYGWLGWVDAEEAIYDYAQS